MLLNKELKKVMVIGSGPIVIGQATLIFLTTPAPRRAAL